MLRNFLKDTSGTALSETVLWMGGFGVFLLILSELAAGGVADLSESLAMWGQD